MKGSDVGFHSHADSSDLSGGVSVAFMSQVSDGFPLNNCTLHGSTPGVFQTAYFYYCRCLEVYSYPGVEGKVKVTLRAHWFYNWLRIKVCQNYELM